MPISTLISTIIICRVCSCRFELREVDKQIENRKSFLDVRHCIII